MKQQNPTVKEILSKLRVGCTESQLEEEYFNRGARVSPDSSVREFIEILRFKKTVVKSPDGILKIDPEATIQADIERRAR